MGLLFASEGCQNYQNYQVCSCSQPFLKQRLILQLFGNRRFWGIVAFQSQCLSRDTKKPHPVFFYKTKRTADVLQNLDLLACARILRTYGPSGFLSSSGTAPFNDVLWLLQMYPVPGMEFRLCAGLGCVEGFGSLCPPL